MLATLASLAPNTGFAVPFLTQMLRTSQSPTALDALPSRCFLFAHRRLTIREILKDVRIFPAPAPEARIEQKGGLFPGSELKM